MRGLVAALLAVLAAAVAHATPHVGVAPNVPTGGGMPGLVRDLQALRGLGCEMATHSSKWSELERLPGTVETKPIRDAVTGLGGLGFQLAVTLQTIDTNNRTVPADLSGVPFDDARMLARWRALLEKVAPHLGKSVRWVMLGNEVDVYLAEHAAEASAYVRFLRAGYAVVKRLAPHVQVGVTLTWTGIGRRAELFRTLTAGSDVVCYTYYPLKPDFGVLPVADVPRDFAAMARMAGPRPWLVQEAGYPASPLLASSDERQAEFVEAVFAAMRTHKDTLKAVCFFLLYDFSDAMLDDLLKYYGIAHPRFRAFLATLGFRRTDGSPRKADAVFAAAMKARGHNP